MEHTQWSHLPLLVSLLIYYHIPIQVQTDHKGSDHKNLSSVLHKALEGAIIFETFPKTIMDVFALVLESMSSKFFHWILISKRLFFRPFMRPMFLLPGLVKQKLIVCLTFN
ncbi:hypothetical protein DVH24_006407 [Malus domestica]|uniref:Uncharacterized protein n=1 Tax=Malus domestica TaxID=3750 RepID=A0A498KA10_MALDO|nr:hypothetical protein DVH24_006407 [Malus domestica]